MAPPSRAPRHLPQSMYDQCSALGFPTSGNAAGHASATDLSGLLANNGWHPRGIGAMFACVFTATLGMASVTCYALGGHIREEMEHEAREYQEARERRGRFFGLAKKLRS